MIPLVKPFIAPGDILMPAISKTINSGYISQGEKVEEFERLLAQIHHLGNKNVLTLNSGTAALHIALILSGVQKGDEVISTAWTAEPTNVAIKMVGGVIKYADIDLSTGNLDPNSVINLISKKTKAIVLVDYSGISADIKSFQAIEKQYNIPVIHDVAHSLGSTYISKPLGNHFTFTACSFQAIKHLTTVDGGCLMVKSEEDYSKAKLMRWFGLDKSVSRQENEIRLQGYKYHMNDLNATIGLIQFKYYEEIISKHKNNAKILREELGSIASIEHPTIYSNTDSSYWFYTIFHKENKKLMEYLNKKQIFSSQLHKRNDLHPFLESQFTNSLPNLDNYLKKMLHIPCGWWLSESNLDYIISTIKKYDQ